MRHSGESHRPLDSNPELVPVVAVGERPVLPHSVAKSSLEGALERVRATTMTRNGRRRLGRG